MSRLCLHVLVTGSVHSAYSRACIALHAAAWLLSLAVMESMMMMLGHHEIHFHIC